MGISTDLDKTELLSLAMEAMERGKYDDALSMLKRLNRLDPKEARAHYLMGSVYAQIGLFDRAEAGMKEAVKLDPELNPARFQLGLIFISSNRPAEAEQTWSPLDALGEEHPFCLFKNGLLQLAKDDFAGCISLLESGMARNQAYPSLNADMEKVLEKVRPLLKEAANEPPKSRHVFLGQYADSGADEPND